MDPHLRASDADRQQIIDALTTHTAAGRLTLDEFALRVDAVNRSTTYGELAAVTADLPTTGGARARYRHPAPAVITVTTVLLAAVLGVLLVAAVAGWGHMNAMMASMSAVMGCR